jgi:hypothetical protein
MIQDAPVVIIEEFPRGFLSNYTTILITLKELIGNRGYNPDSIFISPDAFSLYGNPGNWFLESKIGHPKDSEIVGATRFMNIDAWPTEDQLDLSEYIKCIPYNSRVDSFLKSNLINFDNCLGIHYRGTDHGNHIDKISLERFLSETMSELDRTNYDSVFLATDEINILEFFQNALAGIKVYHNNTIKSKTSQSLHYSGFDEQTRIKLGDEVLLDCHSIANCKSVICATSNIINYARILNSKLNIIYLDKNLKFIF